MQNAEEIAVRATRPQGAARDAAASGDCFPPDAKRVTPLTAETSARGVKNAERGRHARRGSLEPEDIARRVVVT
jgi:hypothetical protein